MVIEFKKIFKFLTLFYLLMLTTVWGQSENFLIFQTTNSEIPSNNITAIAQDIWDSYWFGFSEDVQGNKGGVAKFDGVNWEIYVTEILDSGSTLITDIEVDSLNNIYISTFGKGVVKFDGENWTTIDTSNSDISSNDILCIAIENNNKIWFGSSWGGLNKYESGEWTNYTQQNSELPLDEINQIVIDNVGQKFIGTDGAGLASFDDSLWTHIFCNNFLGLDAVFGLAVDTENNIWVTVGGSENHVGYVGNGICGSFSSTDIGFDFVPAHPFGLGSDSDNIKWIGSQSGLVRYDGNNWSRISSDNSPIPGNWINNVFIDNKNNVWFAFGDTMPNSNGLAVFNENGIIGITDVQSTQSALPLGYSLAQNYPNPFNPSTSIQYAVSSRQFVSLKVYDVLGNEVATLVNEEKPAGSYTVEFSALGGSGSGGDASSLSSGIYFYRLEAGNFSETKKMIILR